MVQTAALTLGRREERTRHTRPSPWSFTAPSGHGRRRERRARGHLRDTLTRHAVWQVGYAHAGHGEILWSVIRWLS